MLHIVFIHLLHMLDLVKFLHQLSKLLPAVGLGQVLRRLERIHLHQEQDLQENGENREEKDHSPGQKTRNIACDYA